MGDIRETGLGPELHKRVQRTIVSGRFREEEVLDVSKKALAQLNITPRGGYFERRTNGWNRPRPDIWRPSHSHGPAIRVAAGHSVEGSDYPKRFHAAGIEQEFGLSMQP